MSGIFQQARSFARSATALGLKVRESTNGRAAQAALLLSVQRSGPNLRAFADHADQPFVLSRTLPQVAIGNGVA